MEVSVPAQTGESSRFEENLADRIRDYWAKRGYRVRVFTSSIPAKAWANQHDQRFYHAARSDLVAGLPREGSEIPGAIVEKPNPLGLPLPGVSLWAK